MRSIDWSVLKRTGGIIMKYVLNEGHELESIDELEHLQDVLLIDNRNNRIIVINVTCAFILREFQEIQDVQEVINSAISFFEGDAETIRNDIEKIIIQLVEEKILCEAVTE